MEKTGMERPNTDKIKQRELKRGMDRQNTEKL
jgi:hypothetical protein